MEKEKSQPNTRKAAPARPQRGVRGREKMEDTDKHEVRKRKLHVAGGCLQVKVLVRRYTIQHLIVILH